MAHLRRGAAFIAFLFAVAVAVAAAAAGGSEAGAPTTVDTASNACRITQAKSLEGKVRTTIRFVNRRVELPACVGGRPEHRHPDHLGRHQREGRLADHCGRRGGLGDTSRDRQHFVGAHRERILVDEVRREPLASKVATIKLNAMGRSVLAKQRSVNAVLTVTTHAKGRPTRQITRRVLLKSS